MLHTRIHSTHKELTLYKSGNPTSQAESQALRAISTTCYVAHVTDRFNFARCFSLHNDTHSFSASHVDSLDSSLPAIDGITRRRQEFEMNDFHGSAVLNKLLLALFTIASKLKVQT